MYIKTSKREIFLDLLFHSFMLASSNFEHVNTCFQYIIEDFYSVLHSSVIGSLLIIGIEICKAAKLSRLIAAKEKEHANCRNYTGVDISHWVQLICSSIPQ